MPATSRIRCLLLGCWIASPAVLAQAIDHASPPNVEAAKIAADRDPACRDIQPFYWEIGTKDSVLASGSTGDGSMTRDSTFNIASASKWVFAAYAIERLHGKVGSDDANFLRMSSGYTNMRPLACLRAPTVKECFDREANSTYTAANDGHFYYGGGHFQKWGVDHGLGPLDRAGLAAEYQRVLGREIPFQFGILQFAGGLRMSAAGYALFLQKILRGDLQIIRYLGANTKCTLPASCPGDALSSPIPVPWHYSYGHWVENDPNGDGSFSSPGAFGFYPWIDASKTHYGMISTRRRTRREDGMGSGYASALCGARIRHAMFQ